MNCAEAEAKFNKTVKCFCFILLAEVNVFIMSSYAQNPLVKPKKMSQSYAINIKTKLF